MPKQKDYVMTPFVFALMMSVFVISQGAHAQNTNAGIAKGTSTIYCSLTEKSGRDIYTLNILTLQAESSINTLQVIINDRLRAELPIQQATNRLVTGENREIIDRESRYEAIGPISHFGWYAEMVVTSPAPNTTHFSIRLADSLLGSPVFFDMNCP